MKDLAAYKLAYELSDSIVAFNENDRIGFIGCAINKQLVTNGVYLEEIINNGLSSEDGKKLLASIKKVRLHHKAFTFKFKGINQEFILLPASLEDHRNVFLSLKSPLDHVSKLESDLNESLKELECLYNVSLELQTSKDIFEAFQKCTEHIKKGFQYPEYASVVIDYKGRIFINDGGSEKLIKNMLTDESYNENLKKRGEIKVIYHKKIPFLKEEIELLKEISRKFTKAVEKEEKTKFLEKQEKLLGARNKKLFELTEECRQSREQLQTFFRAITDKIVVIDENFNIILSNRDEIGNFGKCHKILFNEEIICSQCPAVKTFKNSDVASTDKEFGSQYFKLRSYPILNNSGKVDRVLEVCRNITQEKKMESQLLESYKFISLGKLVAGVAHEINNPNTFILGNIKIIQEALNDILPILDDEFKKNENLKIARLNYEIFKENIPTLIDDMYNGSVKIKKIVEELRNFAKKGDETLSDYVNINDIIADSLRLVKKQIKEDIKVKLNLQQDIPEFIGNISKLEQVMINLVVNASQAINSIEGEIIIITEFDSIAKKILVIVQDNGKGMDEMTKKNIFDPFFTTKRNEGGIGLGLSISYRIIKDHNGLIEVDSHLGKGTRFIIKIPVNKE